MITKDVVKAEIDKVQENYLEILYKIIQAFEKPLEIETIRSSKTKGIIQNDYKSDWLKFIEETYGCLADDQIKRFNQGNYEIREEID